jgi:hypothetical protein
MTSPDLTQANIDKIAELFPSVVTESLDADGNPVRAVDFDLLRQELSDHIVEGSQERYRLDWPGKRAAAFTANAPIAKTLRPFARSRWTSTPPRTSSSKETTSTRSSCFRSHTSARSS